MKIKVSRLALAIAVTGLLGGCATVGPWDSQEIAQLKTNDARMVAGDMVEVLVTEYAPGQTTFALSNGKAGSFGIALESQLRETGYAVAVDDEEKPLNALSLAYILDELGQPGTYRAGVRVHPTYRIERLYQIDSAGQLVQGSGVTVRDGSNRTFSTTSVPVKLTPKGTVAPAMPRPAFPAMPITAERLSIKDYNSPSIETGWSVQVMAGANLDDLERNQIRLERMGRESHIVKLGALGRLQALRVGPFGSTNEARPVLREMRADRYADAFLVEPKRGGGQ